MEQNRCVSQPVRMGQTYHHYVNEKGRTPFFRKLESLCEAIYSFQNTAVPEPPQIKHFQKRGVVAQNIGIQQVTSHQSERSNAGSIKVSEYPSSSRDRPPSSSAKSRIEFSSRKSSRTTPINNKLSLL